MGKLAAMSVYYSLMDLICAARKLCIVIRCACKGEPAARSPFDPLRPKFTIELGVAIQQEVIPPYRRGVPWYAAILDNAVRAIHKTFYCDCVPVGGIFRE